ncbi:MAG: hypothetical protein AAFS04_19925 [Cyanobacteria bacterium J06631_9]
MAKSTFFRYLPARLKPLGKPAVWVPLTVVALGGALIWEYYNNPEWFGSQPTTTLTPASQLTPEEEARLSEIDTLDVLLNGSRAPEGTATVTSQINPDAPEREPSTRESGIATDGDESPFEGSFENYPIPGTSTVTGPSASTAGTSATLTPQSSSLYSSPSAAGAANARAAGTSNRFNFGDGLVNPAAPSTNSALTEALNRRDAAAATESASGSEPSEDGVGPLVPTGNGASRPVGTNGVLPASAPVPGTFIRTTPDMSPPAGTTGYQTPATSSLPTFNVAPQQPTRSPYSAPPAPGQVGIVRPSSSTGSFAVPAPATAVPSAARGSGTASGAGGTLYTAPSSVQPDQGRAINPRR